MIRNPLLAPLAVPGDIFCPTGWFDFRPPEAPYHGHSALAICAADVVRRYHPEGDGGDGPPCGCSRIFDPETGAPAGILTDRGGYTRPVRGATAAPKVMADLAGQWLLSGRLPWGSGPVRLPRASGLAQMGVSNYPYSELTHVLVTTGLPPDLLAAAVAVSHLDVLKAHGGVPVLCLPPTPAGASTDLEALQRIGWPPGAAIFATSEALADQIADQIFVDVDVWPF